MQLDGLRHLVLVDAKSPVSFFAYPGKASDLVPEGCEVHVLAGRDGDPAAALAALADAVGAPADAATHPGRGRPELPTGPLTADGVCQALGALLPEGAIVSDEGNTSGLFAAGAHRRRARATTGSASPAAPSARACPSPLGAAVACPDRQVIALAGRRLRDVHDPVAVDDGPRGARRHHVIFNNRSLRGAQHGARPGRRRPPAAPKAKAMLDLHRPDLDFVALATGMGVPATRATTAEEFAEQLTRGPRHAGPARHRGHRPVDHLTQGVRSGHDD